MMSGKKEDASLDVRRIDRPRSEHLLTTNEQRSMNKEELDIAPLTLSG
jgi:hypothetical protein